MSTTHNRATGWLSLFGSRKKPTATYNPSSVVIEIIGRENSGKTALLDSTVKGIFQANYQSGMRFGTGDPRRVAALIQQMREKFKLMRTDGLPTTLEPHIFEYALHEGEAPRAVVQFRDVVGQILTYTTPDAPPEQQAQYEEYMSHLAQADVLWVVIPCPPANAGSVLVDRFHNDLIISDAYLKEALRKRKQTRPCTTAIVLTKADTLFHDEDEARSRLSDACLIEALRPLVNTIVHSKKIENASIFVASAYGFGKAEIKDPDDEKHADTAEDDVWILRPDEAPDPFNLTSLAHWSVLGALANHEVNAEPDEEPELARICRMLTEDLEALDPWCIQFKGPLVGTER